LSHSLIDISRIDKLVKVFKEVLLELRYVNLKDYSTARALNKASEENIQEKIASYKEDLQLLKDL